MKEQLFWPPRAPSTWNFGQTEVRVQQLRLYFYLWRQNNNKIHFHVYSIACFLQKINGPFSHRPHVCQFLLGKSAENGSNLRFSHVKPSAIWHLENARSNLQAKGRKGWKIEKSSQLVTFTMWMLRFTRSFFSFDFCIIHSFLSQYLFDWVPFKALAQLKLHCPSDLVIQWMIYSNMHSAFESRRFIHTFTSDCETHGTKVKIGPIELTPMARAHIYFM